MNRSDPHLYLMICLTITSRKIILSLYISFKFFNAVFTSGKRSDMAKNDDNKEKKGFIAEFKEFISRGNVLDMAVGIIIGAAFTAIVTSLVDDILSPAIGYLIGGINFSDFSYTFPALLEGMKPAEIKYGVFIQAVISFLLTALAVFCLLKVINKLNRKKPEAPAEEEPAAEPEPTKEELLLTEIRDLLKEQQNDRK